MSHASKLREILLLRHAKSDWKNPETEDINRPISDKGKKAACKIAHWLNEHELLPQLVLVSPAKRTEQTLKRLNLPKQIPVRVLDELYLADLETLIEVLSQIEKKYTRVMLIGHNPGFEKLTQWLTQPKEQPSETRLFPTSSLAHIILPQHWGKLLAGEGRLMNFIRPKEVKLKKCPD